MTGGAPAALVVEDGATHTSLPCVRALAADGWRVGVAAPRRSYASRSRDVSRLHLIPSLGADPAGWASAVRAAAASYDVVLPAGDAEVFALADAALPNVALPAREAVLKAFDKLHLAAAAAEAGFAVPRTVPASEWDGHAPVAVKARHHYTPGARSLVWPTVVATSPGAVRGRLAELAEGGVDAIVQEVVDGTLVHLVLLVDASGVRAAVQQVADRVWPAPVGDLVRGRTVPVEPALLDAGTRLLRDIGWTGLAQLELLRGADGVARLIDLNGRVYGSCGLATAAGVPFPALLARLATGRDLPAVTATVGMRWSALGRDLRGGRGAFVASRGCAHAVWQARDPLPALANAAESARRLARKAVQR
jgi:predicted ATP-grasp superfamily ATP-dependent carboligase